MLAYVCYAGNVGINLGNVGGQRTILPPAALGPSRGEFDFGAGSTGDLFKRRQRHAIVRSSLQARDAGLLHADPPCELGLGPAFLQPGSNQTRRELELRAELFILKSVSGLTDRKDECAWVQLTVSLRGCVRSEPFRR